MKKLQFNVRVRPDTIEKAAKMAEQRGVSRGSIVDDAIGYLYKALYVGRYQACTSLGMADGERSKFVDWCIANDVPPSATMAEWENYLEAFVTADDSADLDATQKNALGVLA